MKATRFLNGILLVIATLLLGILLSLARPLPAGLSFEERAFADTEPGTANLVFHPWINPRRFVFWDKQKNEIYIYDDSGKLEVTWVVGTMGEPLKKK